MRMILALLLLPLSLLAAETPHQPQSFVIGISPYLDKGVKDDVYRAVVRLAVQDLPLNSTLSIYDAFGLKTITELRLPAARAFESAKTRANQFAPALKEFRLFLANDPGLPSHAGMKFENSIRVPQFLDFIDENSGRSNAQVLLVGSPLYLDAKEPGFSMVNGYFPSDGHLQATREKSVYGYSGSPGGASTVHWLYFGDPWQSDLHREKIQRFWALYCARRGARLTGFSGDLPGIVQGFSRKNEPAPGAAATHPEWAIDPDQTKIEMLRAGREVEVADWLMQDPVSGTAQRPPSNLRGPMKIGIRWKSNIDLDLYAAPRSGAETLFFQHPRSPDGYYYKDHRSSPGREYEFIEFERPVDAREVAAAVNFYKGWCEGGPRGEVRIEFEGRIYGASFSIPATEGNRGRAGAGQEDYWFEIPVQEILQIKPAASAAR